MGSFTLETIKQMDLLLLPMEQAAKALSIGTTVVRPFPRLKNGSVGTQTHPARPQFKRKLRLLGIKRWPGRTMKVRSKVDRSQQSSHARLRPAFSAQRPGLTPPRPSPSCPRTRS